MSLSRRPLLIAALSGATSLAAGPVRAAAGPVRAAAGSPGHAVNTLAALERQRGGRLGVAVVDLGGGPGLAHRADERFVLCSTFKLMLATATLAQVDAGRWQARDRLTWTAADAVAHMPMTGEHDGRAGMTVLALAEAAQRHSDNLAANLLVRHLGGPAAFTHWLRAQGDSVTRLDRLEPEMNEVAPGDVRDTTTPAAMAANVALLLHGEMLHDTSRERLLGWMRTTRTGMRRLRAGLPAGWTAGDKTGTGLDPDVPDRIHDVAIFWPPGRRAPLVVAAYHDGPRRGSARVQSHDEATLAAVGRLVARSVAR